MGQMFKKSLRPLFLLAMLCALTISSTPSRSAGAQQQQQQSAIDRKLIAYAEQISGDTFPFVTRTSNGVRVFARSRPRTEVLVAINEGFTELFRIARRHGYTRRLNYTDYTVFIGRADRLKDSQGNYSPDVAVPAGQYAGSGYDQGGFIYAGGMVLTFNPSAFLVAEHDREWQRVSNVVRYEGEHLVLYYNDRALFDKTADHSTGGYHPILQ